MKKIVPVLKSFTGKVAERVIATLIAAVILFFIWPDRLPPVKNTGWLSCPVPTEIKENNTT